jgi:hypothetical protein
MSNVTCGQLAGLFQFESDNPILGCWQSGLAVTASATRVTSYTVTILVAAQINKYNDHSYFKV